MSVLDAHSAGVGDVEIRAPAASRQQDILTDQAAAFLAALHRRFDGQRLRLLKLREARQRRFDRGELPNFLQETQHIRDGDWRVVPGPSDLRDRRIEITGPVHAKAAIAAFNSGAQVFVADFEDSTTPVWANMIAGQLVLLDRWHDRVSYTDAPSGKTHRLADNPAVLMVRPRGWHLEEMHLQVDGAPISASLFDAGLYIFHCARLALNAGSGAYFSLPKIESGQEARLWGDVFAYAEEFLGLPTGAVRASVVIETLSAAFEMDEILYEMREHILGLSCGQRDYIFSYIKRLRHNPAHLLPDRDQLASSAAFVNALHRQIVSTCHRRGAVAIGTSAAMLLRDDDPVLRQQAVDRLHADKRIEARHGYDGSQVTHPDLVPHALAAFESGFTGMDVPDQILDRAMVSAGELLTPPDGAVTEQGLRANIALGLRYIENWLQGHGLLDDGVYQANMATAEICRSQIWQQLRHGARLDDGRIVDSALVSVLIEDELYELKDALGPDRFGKTRYGEAETLFRNLVFDPDFPEFLTQPACQLLS